MKRTKAMNTARTKAGIYIHIPFCVKKCDYCAFLSFAPDDEMHRRYSDALVKETELRRGEAGEADTVYFGGGTPSLLEPSETERILDAVVKNNSVSAGAEITIEANPATLSSEKLRAYRSMGINRLSIGVQSMDDGRLKALGRIHDAEAVTRDIEAARGAGFDNISADIIFSIPGSEAEDALSDLRRVIDLGPDHISFYGLQLEEGTPFFERFECGALKEVDDETDRESYRLGCELLERFGYEHYEISNFALPGKRSRHNSKYWDMSEYLGLGLGASSFIKGSSPYGVRIVNEGDPEKYIEMTGRGEKHFAEMHENTERDYVSEAMFTGLRRKEGVDLRDIFEEGRAGFEAYFSDVLPEIESFCETGHLHLSDDRICLTAKGIDISNRIMALFV